MSKGTRNLLILGVACLIFATTMTTISLTIYKETGDIYLDRSRPGFLPDADEVEEGSAATTSYEFSESGTINEKELKEYLQELEAVKKRLDDFDAYSASPLTDEALGINKPAADVE